MRIIGGKYRGRKLNSPADKNIRPTSDRLRESIFNILGHFSSAGLTGARILDVFAGSGAMGLEALSRGAAHASFFDNSAKSLKLIKSNIAVLAVGEKTTIRSVTAPIFPIAIQPYDVIFLDPPYNLCVINDSLIELVQKDYINDKSIIIVEYLRSDTLILPDFFSIIKEKTCGNSYFCFLMYSH